ncbi:MAG: hypothetical protein CL677_05120 [Bdellovibrionaceae bacterium]|nr:hypothetical protein [Pseudobdellovibrionaceae bacterium]|tara:strand:+ start:91421 stop:92911 length:1491 start_codon:yes stop_codon:yes gene_type:complete
MKILVIQLARFGDILQTAPAINALKRSRPDAEVHVLLRSRFSAMGRFIKGADRVLSWDTQSILGPCMKSEDGAAASLGLLETELENLKRESYSEVYNLSYSPFSSFLTSLVSNDSTRVFGYSRYVDGFLNIPDETSRYFYTQVGTDRPNRAHLVDVFSATLDVHLKESDKALDLQWLDSNLLSRFSNLSLGKYILIHVGASEEHKSVSVFKWKQIIRKICRSVEGVQVVLVGVDGERERANEILQGETFENVINLVGETELTEIFAIANHAKLVIGGDSLWVHVASIVGKKCLNLSFSTVNFWETGPWSRGSEVLYADHEHALSSDQVAERVHAMFTGDKSKPAPLTVTLSDTVEMFEGPGAIPSFQWDLIKALYLGHEFPESPSEVFDLSIIRLAELTALALENINSIREGNGDINVASQILNNVDQLVSSVAHNCVEVQPLIRWFQGNKSLIPPGSIDEIIFNTESCFAQLSGVLSWYLEKQELKNKEVSHAKY